MKSYTDIKQSKVLAKILPIESADMHYSKDFDGSWFVDLTKYTSVKIPKYVGNIEEHLLPCWSLAALLNYLREIDFFPNIEADEHSVAMDINYYNEEEARPLAPVHTIRVEAESFIDACYEIAIKLHGLNLL